MKSIEIFSLFFLQNHPLCLHSIFAFFIFTRFKCHDHTYHHHHITWNYLFTYNLRCVQLLYVFNHLLDSDECALLPNDMYHQFLLVHAISYGIHREDMIIFTPKHGCLLAVCITAFRFYTPSMLWYVLDLLTSLLRVQIIFLKLLA